MKKLFITLTAVVLLFSMALMTACGEKEPSGSLSTIKGAYENSYLTEEDLEQIAYYWNENKAYPEVLDGSIETAIKKTAARIISTHDAFSHPDAKEEDITSLKYLGTYGESVAVFITVSFLGVTAALWTDTVAGVEFHYLNGNQIVIWRG